MLTLNKKYSTMFYRGLLMIIYKVTNKKNGKMYIGQTTQNLKDRWRDHVRGDKQKNAYLHRAICKYGFESFMVEEIDSAKTSEGLNVLEEHYIKIFNTVAPNGYNLLPGGENRRCHEDTKAKISATLKGRPITNRWTEGNSTSPTQETRDKISATLKGRPIKNRWTKGFLGKHSEETKALIRSKVKGVPNKALFKAVLVVETGVVYESINAAAAAHNLNRSTVSGLISTGKPHYKLNVSFRFVEDKQAA